ncbi:hypothetical protein GCM10029964_040600 [Kibdelosporangium lantanae]
MILTPAGVQRKSFSQHPNEPPAQGWLGYAFGPRWSSWRANSSHDSAQSRASAATASTRWAGTAAANPAHCCSVTEGGQQAEQGTAGFGESQGWIGPQVVEWPGAVSGGGGKRVLASAGMEWVVPGRGWVLASTGVVGWPGAVSGGGGDRGLASTQAIG